jgi:hypothetical protein
MATWLDGTTDTISAAELEIRTSESILANTVSNDSTNDLAALQAGLADSIAKKLPMRLRPGIARTTAQLELTAGTPGFVGSGRGYSVINNVAGSNANKPLRATSVTRATLRGFGVKGTATVRSGLSLGVDMTYCSDMLVWDVEVGTGVAGGIFSHKSNRVRVAFCEAHGTLADAFHFTNGSRDGSDYTDGIFIGNQANDSGDDGFAGVDYGNVGDGFPWPSNTKRVTFIGNHSVGSLSGGVANHGVEDFVAMGDQVYSTKANALSIDGEGAYNQGSPKRTVCWGMTLVDGGQLNTSGSWNGVNVVAKDTDVILGALHIENPFYRAFSINAPRVSILDSHAHMDTATGQGIVVGTTSVGGTVCDDTEIRGVRLYDCRIGAIVVLAPSATHSKRTLITDYAIVNPNVTSAATTDGIFCQNVDYLVIGPGHIDDTALRLRAAILLSGCNHVDILPGVQMIGNTTITLSGCTDVLRPTIVASGVPSDTTTYRAGQQYLNTATNKLYVFAGGAWQILN